MHQVRRALVLLFSVLVATAAMAQDSTEPPPPVKAPRGIVTEEALPRAGGVLVFGGTGPLGLEVVKNLVAQKERVTVMVRATSDTTALKALGVNLVTGDALELESVKAAFTAAPFRAAISTLGGRGGDYRVDIDGNRNVFEATQAAGVPRLILVTAIGAGDSAAAPPWYIRWFMPEYMMAKTMAEDYLRATTGIDTTIIRPGWLLDAPAAGTAVLVDDKTKFSWITRADLGKLVAASLEDKATYGRVLTALDPSRESVWAVLFPS